jgi:AAA+ superfamily predicted ATPase
VHVGDGQDAINEAYSLGTAVDAVILCDEVVDRVGLDRRQEKQVDL